MKYYLTGNGEKAEWTGRGLSLGDAINAYGFSLSGIVSNTQNYKTGVLHFVKMSGEAVPMIQYNNESEEHLCAVFQRFIDGKYVDVNLCTLSRALTFM